jgi:hypothetical protein
MPNSVPRQKISHQVPHIVTKMLALSERAEVKRGGQNDGSNEGGPGVAMPIRILSKTLREWFCRGSKCRCPRTIRALGDCR